MGAQNPDRPKKSRSHGPRNRADISGATHARIAAAALSVLSATLASATPTNSTKPVGSAQAGIATNAGNALVVRSPTGRLDRKQSDPGAQSAHARARRAGSGGANAAGGPLLNIAAPTAFGFVKSTTLPNAAPRFVRVGTTLAIVSTPAAPALTGGVSRSAATSAVGSTAGNLTLDNSLSNAGALAADGNGVYLVPSTDGKRVGGNLFYSFSTFDLGSANTASFTLAAGSQPVHNIFARVTGGSSSSIDGAVQSTIPGADVYLINPHGIAFGANATLDVKGSFAVSTANSIALGSAGNFTVTTPSASTLTADAPSAFGFTTSAASAPISFTGSQLSVSAGKVLAVASGPVQLTGATLYAPAGRISIASVSAAGQISIDPSTLDLNPSTSSLALGAISMTANSVLAGDGPTGGAIHIVAGSLAMDSSSISSTTTGAGPGSPINIALTGPLTLKNGAITADTSGSGAAGNISVSAGDATITGGLAAFTGVRSVSAGTGGQAGSITIDALSLQLLDGAQVRSGTFGSGNSGNVTAQISGTAVISGADDLGHDSGIYAESAASGQAGNIIFAADSLTLQDGGQFSSSTSGAGHAGNIKASVSAAALISGTDATGVPAGIYADSYASTQGGDGGNITFSAGGLTLKAGGRISASTYGLGNAGSVTASVSQAAFISGESSVGSSTTLDSGIFAESYPKSASGNAGNIMFSAASLTLQDGGRISSTNYGLGNSGNVTVGVLGAMLLSGGDSTQQDSGIYADSNGPGQGAGVGNIMLSTGSLSLQDGGKISASNFGAGIGGTVTVNVSGAVMIAGEDPGQVGSGIYTEANGSGPGTGAGNVMFTAGSLTLQDGGTFSSTTFGAGRAGDITVAVSGAALISGENSAHLPSGMYAEAYGSGPGAGAGNVMVSAGALTMQAGGTLSSTSFGVARAGDITVAVSGAALISGENSAHLPSGMFAPAYGSGPGAGAGNIVFSAGSLTLQAGGTISSTTLGTGNGGNVTVNVMGDALITGAPSGIFATSTASHGGDAGNIMFSAGNLTLQAGGVISSLTSGSGNGGSVNVAVGGAAVLDTQGAIAAQSKSGATGNAGDVTLTTNSLQVLNGAEIDSSAFGAGNGGNVTVKVTGDAIITGPDSAISATANTSQTGNAGNITMTASSLALQTGGRISSSTAGRGNGGNVTVSVSGTALISGEDSSALGSGIYANTYASGQGSGAGNILFSADSLTLQAGGTISSSTFGAGNGGTVSVNADNLNVRAGGIIGASTAGSGAGGTVTVAVPAAGTITLDAGASKRMTGIIADSSSPTPDTGGIGGDVHVSGGMIRLLHGAQISANSKTAGTGGNVFVNAHGNILLQQSSSISVRATDANAGSIFLNTPAEIQLLSGSQITANAFKSGGDIYIGYNPGAINPSVARRAVGVGRGIPVGLVILDDGRVVARAATENGGRIQINAEALLQSAGSLIDAATPNRKAIQGFVLETNPSQDLSGELAVLPNPLLSLQTPLQDICVQRLGGNFSSFIVTGQGGLPLEPGGWLPAMGFDSPFDRSLEPHPQKQAQTKP